METDVRALMRMDYTQMRLCRNTSHVRSLRVGELGCDGRNAGQLRSIAIKSAAWGYALESTVLSLKNRLNNSLKNRPASA